ncbi:MAG: DNA repair protein RecO [Clostridia bacterium]|nr:DNA repair protein RecO [Clostridia bacterium]
MIKITAPGLVIREQSVGESDRLITVLTARYGLVRAFSRGAKKTKSKKLAATALLAYSDFTFVKTRDAYSVEDALVKEVFFELRNDVEKTSLAQYFCELANEFCEEEFESEEILRLFLNALWLLKGDKKAPSFIKAVTELRLMALSGYMPALVGCDTCGEYESEYMYFSPESGKIYCKDCSPVGDIHCLGASVVQAMRYVSLSDFERIFSFNLNDESLASFCEICEYYLLNKTQRKFKTLDFYRVLSGM